MPHKHSHRDGVGAVQVHLCGTGGEGDATATMRAGGPVHHLASDRLHRLCGHRIRHNAIRRVLHSAMRD